MLLSGTDNFFTINLISVSELDIMTEKDIRCHSFQEKRVSKNIHAIVNIDKNQLYVTIYVSLSGIN